MEIWKDIEGYEGLYQVSNLGNVKSLNYNRSDNEIVLKGAINSHGYKIVSLRNNLIQKTQSIHQLVAIAFLNHKPCLYDLVINHKNFNRSDNRIENLEIVTARENSNLKHLKSSSKYTGVTWNKNANKWQSQIMINSKNKYLGLFKNEYDAHLVYQEYLNKIQNPSI